MISLFCGYLQHPSSTLPNASPEPIVPIESKRMNFKGREFLQPLGFDLPNLHRIYM